MSWVPGGWLPGGSSGSSSGGSSSTTIPGPFSRQTALDIIRGALRRINSYASGETLSSADSNDALLTLNDLLDSMSTEHEAVFGSIENIMTFVPGQYVYTIGHAQAGTFIGDTNAGGFVVSTTVPTDLIAHAYIQDSYGAFPANTYVVSVTTGAVTLSNAATLNASGAVFSYTIPGDFYKDDVTGDPILRPLRITNAFTRITNSLSALDYPISIVDQNAYTKIGFKGISAPWPIALWYNQTMPLGTLSFYQNPSTAGSLHLFTDFILTSFPNLTTYVTMPQGYIRWLKWALAKELAPEYMRSWTATHERNWKEARDAVKSLNSIPAQVAEYDSAILKNVTNDAGWILHGGFR